MRKMTGEEWRAFVSQGTRTGKLATVRADGRPHVAPVGFVLDEDEVVFTTGRDSVKGRNLLRDGRAALCVDDEQPPYAFVTIEGRAVLSEDLGLLRHWAALIAARYLERDRAQEFADRVAVDGELLVRVRAEKVIAYQGLAD